MPGSADANVRVRRVAIAGKSHSRSRQPKSFTVEVVKFKAIPANKENPYARFSADERYEIVIKYLAEIWAGISKRAAAEARTLPGQRKEAA